MARHGLARLGMAWHSRAWISRQGTAGYGMARLGEVFKAGPGMAWLGMAWLGEVYEVKKRRFIMEKKWEKLMNTVIKANYGDVLLHQDISSVIGIKGRTRAYYSTIISANKRLIKRGKMLVNVNNLGYRVLDPNDYTAQSVKEIQAGRKRINKACDILTYAPIELMDADTKSQHMSLYDRMHSFKALVETSTTEIKLLGEPKIKINK